MGNAAAGGRGPEPWGGPSDPGWLVMEALLPQNDLGLSSQRFGERCPRGSIWGEQSKSPPSFPRKAASNHVDAPRLGTVDSLCSVSGLPLTRVDCAGNRREPAVPICVRGLAATGRVQGGPAPRAAGAPQSEGSVHLSACDRPCADGDVDRRPSARPGLGLWSLRSLSL